MIPKPYPIPGLDSCIVSESITDVFRPIQYLGSKMRALNDIVEVMRRLTPPPKLVHDMFSGTSVVSQALSQSGYGIVATDAMRYSVVFARALLGIGNTGKGNSWANLLSLLSPPSTLTPVHSSLEFWLLKEQEAIERKDSKTLLEISQSVPQIWRPETASASQLSQYEKLNSYLGKPGFSLGTIVSSYYSGTYFGISQALEIDRLRVRIEELEATQIIAQWQKDVLLTALLATASDCVFSAGKHFAQPHRIREDKDLSFLRKRILEDRGVDVWTTFCARVLEVVKYSSQDDRGHIAYQATLEDFRNKVPPPPNVDVVYADPPYTAQQYSRFYHIPEILVEYKVPTLQEHRGNITRGLYPLDRHKSRFCSKRDAPKAFDDLFRLVKGQNAVLMLSYSATDSGKTGNERMISLDEIEKIGQRYFDSSKHRLLEFDHEYRQFNQARVAISGRDDKEFLLVFEG